MTRKILICFSNEPTAPSRLNLGDVLIIVRKNRDGYLHIVQELQYQFKNDQGTPVISPSIYESLDEYIQDEIQKGPLKVEILGHSSSKSAHFIYPTETENYSEQRIAIDELAAWLEYDMLKKNIGKVSISLIVCQAGAETNEFPAMAAQMFALFTEKPHKITARKGFILVSNQEKMYSLSTFDMLLHKAFISKDISPNTILESLSFSALRGLRTFLNTTRLHTYDNTTPLNEKLVYFKNSKGESLKIDNHLYQLYHLSQDRLDKPLEDCTKEDFIKLANLGMQSLKDTKLYKKSELILKDISAICTAEVLQVDLKNYQLKEMLFKKIDELYEKMEATPQLDHARKIAVLLNIIEAYVNERYILNLPVDSIEPLFKIIDKIIAQEGQFNPEDYQEIDAVSQYIKSSRNTELDVSEHMRLADLQLPTYKNKIAGYCIKINGQFSRCLESFSKIIKIENQLVDNAKMYEIKSIKNEKTPVSESFVISPEESSHQIQPDIENLRQLIHHQMLEASHLLSFNKFSAKQSQILTSMLQLIHVRQRQESKQDGKDTLATLLLQTIKLLEDLDPKHPRSMIIVTAANDFVSKHYNALDYISSLNKMKPR